MDWSIILWLIAGHFLGDFPAQSQWMAAKKGTSWEVNGYHALVYTFTILVVSAIGGFILPIWSLAIIGVSHFLIDPLKARWSIVKHIWLDQLLHIIVLFVTAFALAQLAVV
jgi:hypothetical protein